MPGMSAIALLPHLLISTTTYFTNLSILVVVGLVGWFTLRWLMTKARASRHRAWAEAGLLEPDDARLDDPDLSEEYRARLAARDGIGPEGEDGPDRA